MEELVRELGQNGRADVLLAGLAVAIILMIVQIHKTNKVNKKIDAVVKSVENYLSIILEDDEKPEQPAGQPQAEGNSKKFADDREDASEAQNRLISAVLQEIFP